MTPRPRIAISLLESPSGKACLVRLELHRRILEQVRSHLPPALAAHCQDCLLKEKVLMLFVDDPLWTFQLRFQLPTILAGVNRSGICQAEEIRVRNVLGETSKRNTIQPPRKPGKSAMSALKSCAAETRSQEIKVALLRLLATFERT